MNYQLGRRIKDIRLRLGKNQEEFGQLFDPPAPKSAVSRWEHGGYPNRQRLVKIAKIGNISIGQLVNGLSGIMEMNDSYLTVLPAGVRYDPLLSANEKLLYSEVAAIANMNDGICEATNAHLAKVFSVSKVSISNWLSNLVKQKYLKRQIIKDGKQIVARKLLLTGKGW